MRKILLSVLTIFFFVGIMVAQTTNIHVSAYAGSDFNDSNLKELNAEGVVISNTNAAATATGVLVLETNDRALALPKVEGVENIQAPKTGMICYDITRKSLAIFNGEKWILRN